MSDKTVTIDIKKNKSLLQNDITSTTEQTTHQEKHHKKLRNKIGVCMDHHNANFICYTNNPTETTTVESDFTNEMKADALGKSENIMHNKEQQQLKDFYKKIITVLKNYDEILLFGPTDAKTELANILSENHYFDKIEINVIPTDKMNENQQHAYVHSYFSAK